MTTITRAILEAEGSELDYVWDLAQVVVPTLTRPADGPDWAIADWEACLRLPGRSIWTEAHRRASIIVHIGQAVLETEVIRFIATETRCSIGALAFAYTVADQVDITTTGLTADQVLAVTAASLIIIPAHMAITVDTVVIR